MLSIEKDNIL